MLVSDEKELGSVLQSEQCIPEIVEGDERHQEVLTPAGSAAADEHVAPLCGPIFTPPSTPPNTMIATEMDSFADVGQLANLTSALHGLSISATDQTQDNVNELEDMEMSGLDGARDDVANTVVGDDAATTGEQVDLQKAIGSPHKRRGRAAKTWLTANELVSYARLRPSPRSSLDGLVLTLEDGPVEAVGNVATTTAENLELQATTKRKGRFVKRFVRRN